MKPSVKIAALIALVLLVAGYALAAPYITAYEIGSAIENNDADALAQHIDFPALRQSLKDELKAAMAKNVTQELDENPFATLGALFAGTIIDRMIDALMTPAGLRMFLKGGTFDPKALSQSDDESNYKLPETSMSYESLRSFCVTVKPDGMDNHIELILKRDGLDWNLAEIRL